MDNLNSVLIEGNLTRDPELSYTPQGTALCRFSIAVNRYRKGNGAEPEKEVSFFDITCWAKLAQTCGEYLKKGRGVRVVGRLKQERWSTPEGQQRSRVGVVAEHVEFKPAFKTDRSEPEGAATADYEPTAEELGE